MANSSQWSSGIPSGDSSIRVGDDDIRSTKSILQATLEEEHYFTDGSTSSAGQHKLGSARIFVGTASQVSARADSGRLMYATDTKQLHYVGSEGTRPLGPRGQRIIEAYKSSGGDRILWQYSHGTGDNNSVITFPHTYAVPPIVTFSWQTSTLTTVVATLVELSAQTMQVNAWSAGLGALGAGTVIIHYESMGT